MRTRSVLGTALAAVTTGALALAVPGPSYSRPEAAAPAATSAAPTAAVAKDRAVRAATRYLGQRADTAFRASTRDTFRRVAATPGTAGTYYVAYERTHRGLPVVGGDFVVAVDKAGKVTGRTSAQERVIRLRTTQPTKTRAQARRVATRPVTTITRVSKPKLVVYAEGTPRLAWQTKVAGTKQGQPTRQTVWTDARTGKVLDRFDLVMHGTGTGYYNGPVSIGTSGSGSSFSMTDPARPGVRCGGQNGSAYTGTDDAWGNGSGTSLETACSTCSTPSARSGTCSPPGSVAAASRATAPATRHGSG